MNPEEEYNDLFRDFFDGSESKKRPSGRPPMERKEKVISKPEQLKPEVGGKVAVEQLPKNKANSEKEDFDLPEYVRKRLERQKKSEKNKQNVEVSGGTAPIQRDGLPPVIRPKEQKPDLQEQHRQRVEQQRKLEEHKRLQQQRQLQEQQRLQQQRQLEEEQRLQQQQMQEQERRQQAQTQQRRQGPSVPPPPPSQTDQRGNVEPAQEGREIPVLRSEEVHEILTQVPNWMIRWGTTLVFGIIAAIITMSYFIKYPDVVAGRIILTSSNPPVSVVSQANGPISLLREDKTNVKEREVFAYVKGSTKFEDVITLNRKLKSLKQEMEAGQRISTAGWPELELGQMQATYNNLVLKIKEADQFSQTENNNISRKNNIDQQIEELRNIQLKRQENINLLRREYDQAKGALESRYRPLLRSGVISATEFESREAEVLRKESNYQGAKTSLNETKNRILSLESQKAELDYSEGQQTFSNQSAVSNAYASVINQVKLWEDQYLLRAPIGGKINYLQFVKENTYIRREQPLASIIPLSEELEEGKIDAGKLVGELLLPARGAGKVEVGQSVNVELDDYLKKEYGVVKGEVISISDITSELQAGPETMAAYKIYISFPEGLNTKSEQVITFRHNMGGTAEIITEDVRLISRIFNELQDLFDNIGE